VSILSCLASCLAACLCVCVWDSSEERTNGRDTELKSLVEAVFNVTHTHTHVSAHPRPCAALTLTPPPSTLLSQSIGGGGWTRAHCTCTGAVQLCG
jgi:hypothetical protein